MRRRVRFGKVNKNQRTGFRKRENNEEREAEKQSSLFQETFQKRGQRIGMKIEVLFKNSGKRRKSLVKCLSNKNN